MGGGEEGDGLRATARAARGRHAVGGGGRGGTGRPHARGRASAAACDAVNVHATERLLQLAREVGSRRFVYTSSLECAYHDNSCVHAAEETSVCGRAWKPAGRVSSASCRSCASSISCLTLHAPSASASVAKPQATSRQRRSCVCSAEPPKCSERSV